MPFPYGTTYSHQFYIIWQIMWFGELGVLQNSLNHCWSAQQLSEFNSCNINQPNKAPPSNPSSSKLTPNLHHKAPGTTLRIGNRVHGAGVTPTTSEHWRSKKSRLSLQVTLRAEKEWKTLSPSRAFLTLGKLNAGGLWVLMGNTSTRPGFFACIHFTCFMHISWCFAVVIHSKYQLEQV